MTILQRYVFREWLVTLLAVTVVLLIVLMGLFLGELLNDIADGRVPASLLGMQMALQVPQAMVNILPLSAFIAVMWGLGRLYRDQEMAVMRSNGFGWREMVRPLLVLVLPVSGALLLLSYSLAPASATLADRKLEEAFRSAAVWGLKPGQFHVMHNGDFVVYVEELGDDGRTLRNIFVEQRNETWDRVWIARRGAYWMDPASGRRFLSLAEGQITDSKPGKSEVRMLTFERNDLQLPEPERESKGERIEASPVSELLTRKDAEAVAELQWRATPAVLAVVLGMLAIPLSHSAPREGRGSRVVLGILFYAIYMNTLYLCRGWIADDILPPFSGLWWVHGVVFLIALLLLQRQGRMIGRD